MDAMTFEYRNLKLMSEHLEQKVPRSRFWFARGASLLGEGEVGLAEAGKLAIGG